VQFEGLKALRRQAGEPGGQPLADLDDDSDRAWRAFKRFPEEGPLPGMTV
jgi:hypothetical protein